MEYMRRAIRERLDRDADGDQRVYVTPEQVREIIREELRNYERVAEER